MSWLKRNLFFAIGSLVALILMGLAGWFLYSKWSQNNDVLASLNNDYEELKNLNSKNPHPGSGSINNIQLAKEQRTQLLDFMKKTGPFFAPVPRVPDLPKITDRDFSAALSQTIEQLRAQATNASVALPAENYSFSFAAQKSKISFALVVLENPRITCLRTNSSPNSAKYSSLSALAFQIPSSNVVKTRHSRSYSQAWSLVESARHTNA